MPTDYVAYIDEAGDEGFGKLAAGSVGGQSRWLVLGACIAAREHDLHLPLWRDQILALFPQKKSRDLHFRDLNHAQKVAACQRLAELPLQACLTLSHKVTIPGSQWEQTFKQKGYLYNYLLRWLLERVTTFCANQKRPCTLKVIFSRRGGTNYQSMIDYLCLMRDGRELFQPVRSIRWDVLNVGDIAVENHSKWAGLQVADCFTSAFYCAVEPNIFGNREEAYARLLKNQLIKSGRNALNVGLTAVPSLQGAALSDSQLEFFLSFRN
jgi:Protein of unknown function (DUF3800)